MIRATQIKNSLILGTIIDHITERTQSTLESNISYAKLALSEDLSSLSLFWFKIVISNISFLMTIIVFNIFLAPLDKTSGLNNKHGWKTQ